MSTRRPFIFFGLTVVLSVTLGISTATQDETASTQARFTLKAGRNVNMVSGTTLPQGDPWLQRQNEPSLAVSTRNILHLLAGANDYRTVDMPMEGVGGALPGKDGKLQPPHDAWLGLFKSFDGGQSWKSTLLPGFPQDHSPQGTSSSLKGFRAAADPVVRAGSNGLFFYCGIVFNREKAPGSVNSAVFLARFIDNNNVEGGDSIKYLDAQIIATDDKDISLSVDKPWIAIDRPSDNAKPVTIDGQKIPAFNVYVVYSVFKESGDVLFSEIWLRRSTDCGQTWEKPVLLSNDHILNQGSVIAIDPRNSENVYVAWRRFNSGSQGSAIILAKSTNYGKTFARAVEIASLPQFPGGPFDQPSKADTPESPGTSFRTNSYPTVALDGRGVIYLAWAQRGLGPDGATRVVLTTSKDGSAWTTPTPIDYSPDVLGHQFMPSLAVGSGKVTLIWYDQREDFAGNNLGFREWICDDLPYRHTIDVRAAQASAADYPYLNWTTTQVSRYLFSLEPDLDEPDTYTAYQAQFNPPNYPLFQSGTLSFHGDYIDISPSPWFVRDSKGRWRFNVDPSENPLFHATWTDNRDVRPPSSGNWVDYTPPSSEQASEYISENHPACAGGQQPGMRNQNIYTSRLTTGVESGTPANSKVLNLEVPRAFVIFVKNNTDILRSFRLTIANQPTNGMASFLQFEQLDVLDISIAPFSTISRQVFVDSTDLRASVNIDIREIDAPEGTIVPDGLKSSIVLNEDPTSPAVSTAAETHQPEIGNPNIRNWYVNPNVVNPNIRNEDIINDDIVNPNIRNIVTPNINLVNPNVVSASIFNPNIRNSDLLNPNIVNPNIRNPNIRNDSPEDIQIIDVEWPVRNAGNTASSFTFKLIAKEALPPGLYAQLIIYKVHYTPAVAGEALGNDGVDDCTLMQEPHHQVLLNVVNPNMIDPDVVNPNIRNPNIRNAAIENATFMLGPNEEAIVDLRIIQTQETQEGALRTQDFPLPTGIEEFVESLGGAVTSQSVDSEDAEQGETEPPAAATTLIITTTTLPPGIIGSPYPVAPYTSLDARLKAVGGTEPYSWWVNPSDLPPGLVFNTASGQIAGTPVNDPAKTYPVIYRFMAQVTDAGNPQQTHSQLLSITVEDPYDPPPPLTITTPSPLPTGTAGKPYGTTLEAVGGKWPYSWAVKSGTLPPGLVLDSGGFISGTPQAEGTYYFRIRVIGSGTPPQTAEKDYGLTIRAATAPTYTISGTIRIGGSGTPLSGVLLRGLPGAPTTNSSGFYTDTVPQGWSGTVIPFKAGYQFMPSERTYASVTSNQLNQDFATYTVDLDHFEISAIYPQTAGLPFPVTITAKAANGSTVTTYKDWNTLNDTTGTISPTATGAFLNGVWTGNVTIMKASPSVTISTAGSGKTGQSNAFSVIVGSPSAVKIEDTPDGTGTEVGAKTLGSGHQLAVYAISRDVGNNFIGNVEVAWSLIDKTGGVVDGDLVPAGDNKSALFTAHAVGTAGISADHATLLDDTTGIITVVETQPDDIYEDNDTFATAAALPFGTHQDLVLYDEDWYKFYVTPADAGKDLKIRLKITSVPDPSGSRDLDFHVFDSSEKLLGSTYSSSFDELLFLADVAAGWYYVGHTHFYVAQEGSVYSLTAEVGDDFGIGYISGRVTDRQGNGLENIFIEARSPRSWIDWNVSFPMIVTNSNGEYKIGCPPDDYRIIFNGASLAAYDEPWIPIANFLGYTHAEVISVAAGATVADINARLEQGGSISGRVTDRSGNPLQMALVTAFNGSGGSAAGAWTKANGEYRLNRLRTGNYKLRFRPNRPLGIGWYGNGDSLDDAVPVPVQVGAETSGIDAQLGNGAAVAGRVTDGSGNPIQGVSVNFYDVAGISLFGARTDASGEYMLYRLPPGPVRVFFDASTAAGNYASEYYSDKPVFSDADPVVLHEDDIVYGIDAVLAAGGAVSGRVTDAAGLPLWAITVTCFAVDSGQTYSASTDVSGNYLIKGLLPGNYRIRFQQSMGQYQLEWYNDRNSFAAGDTISIGSGGTVSGLDAQLALSAGGSVSGRVTNGSGAGIEGVLVQVYDGSRRAGISSARTNQGGYYSVSRIPGGEAKVFVNADYPFLREASEYYNDKNSFEAANPVNVLEAQTIPLNDSVLGLVPALEITSETLPDGEVGIPYMVTLVAAGGRPFYRWSLVSGTLPEGLTFNSKGEIEGTPAAEVESCELTFQVLDSTSPAQQYATKIYSLVVGAYTGPGYVISGRITQGGTPLAGVLLDGLPGPPTTNANGEYTAPVSPGWSGTVTPTLAGFAFDPANRTYSGVGSNFTEQDYSASAGYEISGTITLDGAPLPGVLMNGLPGTPHTNADGFYRAAIPSGLSITVTPSQPGISFDPPNRTYTNVTSNQTGEDYVASYVGGQDDAYEENDSFAAAAEISLGVHAGLVLTDEDWFKVYVPAWAAGKDLKISLVVNYFPSGARRDVDIMVVNSAGKLLSANYSGSGDEIIFLPNVSEGWYFIGSLYIAAPGVIYTLTAEVGDGFGIGYIEGLITDPQGIGIENVFVEVYPAPHRTWDDCFVMITTGADGRFKVGNFPGSYILRFNQNVGYLWPFFDSTNYVGEIYKAGEALSVTAGSTTDGIEARLEPSGTISGRILGPDGNPLPGAIAYVYASDNSRVSYGRSDEDGYYSAKQLRTGNYRVRFRLANTYYYEWFDNTYSLEDGLTVAVQAGQTTPNVDARFEDWAETEGFIEGRVTDATGVPIGDVTVTAYDGIGSSLFSTNSDADGSYRLMRLPPGPIRVFFNGNTAGGYDSEYYLDKATLAGAIPVEVRSGQTTFGIDAQLAAGGTIRGRVTDAAGNPFSGVSISCLAVGSERLYNGWTNMAGEYTVGVLPPGDYKVFFYRSLGNHLPEWYDDKNSFNTGDVVSVAAGENVSGIDAQLIIDSGGAISGRVTNGDGNGIEGLPVLVYDGSRPAFLSSSGTDSDGYYTVRRIPAGNAKVFINTNQDFLGSASEFYNDQTTFDTATPVTILQGETTSGIDAALGPLPNLEITISSLPDGEIGAVYDVPLLASGGRPFYYWTLVSGALPDGLTLNSKGEIHGTPTVEDTFNFTVRVIDSTSPTADQQSATQSFSLTVGAYAGPGFLISGRITQDGSPVAGVLLDGLPGSPVTGTNGEYVSPVSPGWSGTVTPVLAGHAFEPANRTYTSVGSNFTNQDYAASPGWTISGSITIDGAPLPGVLMNGLPGTPQTNADGFYTTAVPSGWSGTVTPSLPGLTFDPAERSYAGVSSNQTGQDYAASYVGGEDDAYEENDTFEAAAEISLGTHTGLVLNDFDWFKVFVPVGASGKDLKINLKGTYFPDPNARRDLDMLVLNSDGKLLSASYSGSGDETIFLSNVSEGWYVIGNTYIEAPGTLYTLTAEVGDQFGIGYIEGRVTDPAGMGIEGAYVELYREPPNWNYSFPMMTTDADGRFRIGFFPGNYTALINIWYTADREPFFHDVNFIGKVYNAGQVLPIVAGTTTAGINVTLEPGGTIAGRVLDPSGTPLSLGIVYAYNSNNVRVSAAYCDANGYYDIKRLRTGNYKVRFRPSNEFSYEWFDDSYSFEDGLPVAVESGLTTPHVDAWLDEWTETEGSIAGRVTDAAGNPIPNVSVYALDGTGYQLRSAGTDENGEYSLYRVSPGPIRIFFNASAVDGLYVSEYYPDKASLREAVPVVAITGQTVSGIDAQLAVGGALSGRITDADENPLQGVAVTAYSVSTDRYYSRSTNINGDYYIKGLQPGEYKIRFQSPAGSYLLEWHDNKNSFGTGDALNISAGETISGLDARLEIGEGGAITGRVTDGGGAGLEGVTVTVYDGSKAAPIASAGTNAEGIYTVSRIPAGGVKVFVNTDSIYLREASEYYNNKNAFEAANLFNIVPDEAPQPIDFILSPGPSLAISADSLPNGEVGAAYDVSLQATGGRPFYCWSIISGSLPDGLELDSNGEIRGTPMVEGSFNFTVRVIDSTSPTEDRQLATRSYDLTIGAYTGMDYFISGQVLFEGLPLPGVTLTGLPGNPATTTQGKYMVAVSPGWSGTVAPLLAGYAFSPTSRTYSEIGSNLENEDYAASIGHAISGMIALNGSPLQGVWMYGLPGTPKTNWNGSYTGYVLDGWSGTVSPGLAGYSFNPLSRSYTNVTADQPGQDYSALTGGSLYISTGYLPGGTRGAPYDATVIAANGTEPYSWSLVSGELPAGLTLSEGGRISGTPEGGGDYNFTVRVTDSSSPPQFATRSFGLNISPAHQGLWTTTYPFGASVFTRGIAIDPNNPSTVYLTTLWRGLFRSQDGGGHWSSVTDNLDVPFDKMHMGTWRLRSADEIYMACDQRVFKTTDAGVTWTQADSGISGVITALTLHPTDAGTLYVGTQSGQVFRSTNGGQSWSDFSTGLPGAEIRRIEIDPHDPLAIYAGSISEGLFRSLNNGPWVAINGDINLVRVEDIVFDPGAPVIYVAAEDGSYQQGIFKTMDGAVTWTKLPLDLGIRWEPGFYIAVDPASSSNIYTISGHSVFSSNDAGSTWVENPVTGSAVTCLVLDPANPGVLYAGTEQNGVQKSTNGGATWSEVNTGIRGLIFPHSKSHSIHIDATDPDIIYAGSINGGYRSLDGGQTWEKMDHPGGQIPSIMTHPADPGTVITFHNQFWKSGSNGTSGTWIDPTSGSFCCFGGGDLGLAYSDELIVYAGVSGSWSMPDGVYQSLDGGASWIPRNNGLAETNIHTLVMHPTNSDIVFVATGQGWPIGPGTSSRIFRTTDAGGSWEELRCGLPTFLSINQIIFYPGDPNIMYLGAEIDNGGVYRSDDGGNCWRQILGGNINTIAVHPANPDIVYAGAWNAGGFHVTLNGGQSWMTINDGLPRDPGIESMALDPRNPFHLFMGTSAGVFEITLSIDLSITTATLPPAAVNEAYFAELKASGGTPSYGWEITSGSLPPGMSLNPDTGEISGLSPSAGTFDFTVRLTDDAGQTFARQFTLVVLNTFVLNTIAEPAAGGSVTRNPDQPKYMEGIVVDVNATPNAGYVFTGWSGDASGKAGLIHVQMTKDKNIAANFALLASLPDYYVSSSSWPSAAAAGDVIAGSASVTVGNQGALDLNPAGVSVGLYLSTDSTITTSDTLLWKGRTSIAALEAGATVGLGIDPGLQIPTTLTSGGYYIGVLVDEFDAVPERDEANNSAGQAITISSSGYGALDILGGWPYGTVYGFDLDPARNLAVIGNGGMLQILDTSDPSQPALISQLSLAPASSAAVKIIGDKAYVAAGGAGLKVIDISDPLHPAILATCAAIESARSLDVSGDYAYVTDHHLGFRIIDISNPGAPVQTAFLPFTGRTRLIKVTGSYAYVTRQRDPTQSEGPRGVQIIDIQNPTNPVNRAFIETGSGPGEPDVDSSGRFLFVPVANDSLRVYDVSDPDAPIHVFSYFGTLSPIAVSTLGNFAYVLDQNEQKVVVLDISDATNPAEVSVYRFPIPVAFFMAKAAGSLCFISSWYDSLRIIDFSDPGAPEEAGFYEVAGMVNYADVTAGNAFVSNRKVTQSRLKVLDISALPDITETAALNIPFPFYDVAISGDSACLPADNMGLRIVDISNPSAPAEVGAYESISEAQDVAISGRYAYVADGSSGLRVFDLSNPSHPVLVSTLNIGRYVIQVAVSGHMAYLAANYGGLRIIDISDPLNPWQVGAYEYGLRAINVSVAGDYAYVICDYNLLRIINVSDPRNPVETGTLALYCTYGDSALSGNFLFVPDWIWGLRVIDVSNPASPNEVGLLREFGTAEEVVIRENRIYVVNRDAGFYVLEFRPSSP